MNSLTLHGTSKSVSERVIDAIATATDTDPLGMKPPLYSTIDPEALDRLFERGGPEQVLFEYDGHEVAVRGDGTVAVDEVVYDRES